MRGLLKQSFLSYSSICLSVCPALRKSFERGIYGHENIIKCALPCESAYTDARKVMVEGAMSGLRELLPQLMPRSAAE